MMTFRYFGSACDILGAVYLFGVGSTETAVAFFAASAILFAMELREGRSR